MKIAMTQWNDCCWWSFCLMIEAHNVNVESLWITHMGSHTFNEYLPYLKHLFCVFLFWGSPLINPQPCLLHCSTLKPITHPLLPINSYYKSNANYVFEPLTHTYRGWWLDLNKKLTFRVIIREIIFIFKMAFSLCWFNSCFCCCC